MVWKALVDWVKINPMQNDGDRVRFIPDLFTGSATPRLIQFHEPPDAGGERLVLLTPDPNCGCGGSSSENSTRNEVRISFRSDRMFGLQECVSRLI